MSLDELIARRVVLLDRCTKTDRAAAAAREKGEFLDLLTIAGFESHVELAVVNREIAKLRERK